MVVSQNYGYHSGAAIIRSIVFWGSILGSSHFGKLPYDLGPVSSQLTIFGLWLTSASPQMQDVRTWKFLKVGLYWVAAKEIPLCYSNKGALLYTIYP